MGKPKNSKQLTSVETQLPSQEENRNVTALEHLMLLREIPKPNINDNEQVAFACESYIKICMKTNQKPLVSGLAMVLGITRKKMLDILQGKERSEARDVIEEYFGVLEAYDELALKDGKINAVAGIFLGKNNYGYTDGVKLEITKEEETNEAILKKYGDRNKVLKGEEVEIVKRDDD